MLEIPPWQPQYNELAWALMLFVLGFTAYHFISHANSIKELMKKKYGIENTLAYWVLFQKYIGFIFLGLIPFIIIIIITHNPVAAYGISFKNILISLYWILGLGVIIILVNLINARTPKSLTYYPQIRKQDWSYALFANNMFSWIIYLLGYEFIFRGLLLSACVRAVGVWPAIIINIVLYSLAHVPKNLQETLASIPLGLLLCLITLHTENIWVALGVHIILAVSNDWIALWAHPTIKIKR